MVLTLFVEVVQDLGCRAQIVAAPGRIPALNLAAKDAFCGERGPDNVVTRAVFAVQAAAASASIVTRLAENVSAGQQGDLGRHEKARTAHAVRRDGVHEHGGTPVQVAMEPENGVRAAVRHGR